MQSQWPITSKLHYKKKTVNHSKKEKGVKFYVALWRSNDKNYHQLSTSAWFLKQKSIVQGRDEKGEEKNCIIENNLHESWQEGSIPTII